MTNQVMKHHDVLWLTFREMKQLYGMEEPVCVAAWYCIYDPLRPATMGMVVWITTAMEQQLERAK